MGGAGATGVGRPFCHCSDARRADMLIRQRPGCGDPEGADAPAHAGQPLQLQLYQTMSERGEPERCPRDAQPQAARTREEPLASVAPRAARQREGAVRCADSTVKCNKPWRKLLKEPSRPSRSKLLWPQMWRHRCQSWAICIWTRTPMLTPWWLMMMLLMPNRSLGNQQNHK